MCGIAGIFKLNGSKVERHQLKVMTDSLYHRGPDGDGFWESATEDVGFGHRRLSILDLSSAGEQPMHYRDQYTITFNGEIYNYLEIKARLIAQGHKFVSDTDTEVLLVLYSEKGERCLDDLDGMFAFSIWDNKEQKLFCARDRFGEKPFYYHYLPDACFMFASEMKALFVADIEKKVDQHMLFNYLAYDVIEDPFDKQKTFYENIYKLEAAHYITISKKNGLVKKRYWNHPDYLNIDTKISFQEANQKLKELFDRSVKRRLRSDVTVGSSLSGGLDSSAIVCTIAKLIGNSSQELQTFSARFYDESIDEGRYIEKVIAKTHARPHYIWPEVDEMVKDIERLFYHQEEPFTTASIFAQWEVMKLAKKNNVIVLLDGQGADEILAGYNHYMQPFLRDLYKNNKVAFKEQVKKYNEMFHRKYPITFRFKVEAYCPDLLRALGRIRRTFTTPEYLKYFHTDFVNHNKTKEPPFKNFNTLNEVLGFATFDYGLEKLLRFSDRNSMAHSREVRLPFLNHELVEFIFTLPASFKIHNGWRKRILRTSMEDVLPKEIAWRIGKIGYEAPQQEWMKHPDLLERVESAKDKLIKENIIVESQSLDPWKLLIADRLLSETFKR